MSANSHDNSRFEFETRALVTKSEPERWSTWDLIPPLSTTTTFKQVAPGKFKAGYDYSRHGNPTRDILEATLAAVEEAKHSLVFSSGMAAASAVTLLLSAGDHIVSVDDLYGGVSRLFSTIASRFNMTVTYVDGTDAENVVNALRDNTRLIWLETPSNPQLKVADIKKISDLVHEKNPDILVAVDNTFLTPFFQRPLELGADISVMSLSKYVNGHHDIIMGSTTFNRDDLQEQLYDLQKSLGIMPSPTDCQQVIRSIKTLDIRLLRHQMNSLEVAQYLQKHPQVAYVNHPLLPSHPQYQVTKKQTKGHSGMLSFGLKGETDQMLKFLAELELIQTAASLGGYGSTVAIPNKMVPMIQNYVKKAADSQDFKKSVDDNLIRISVGIENIADLINDLDEALKKAFA